jgi:hypothetical protein
MRAPNDIVIRATSYTHTIIVDTERNVLII